MEEKIRFENSLYDPQTDDIGYNISDIEFLVDRLVCLPLVRPFLLEKAVTLCVKYASTINFLRKLLSESKECPVLIYRLYKRGVISFQEIEPILRSTDSTIYCYYFRKEFIDFELFAKKNNHFVDFDRSLIKDDEEIDRIIQYGFHPSSIEYCLKYDDIDVLRDLNINDNGIAKWSPFEWSYKLNFLDYLSFSGYFGSINCFKHLIINGYQITDSVKSSVVCSGSFDLFRLCNGSIIIPQSIFCAAQFCRLSLLSFFLENSIDISIKDECIRKCFLILLFFIIPLNLVI